MSATERYISAVHNTGCIDVIPDEVNSADTRQEVIGVVNGIRYVVAVGLTYQKVFVPASIRLVAWAGKLRGRIAYRIGILHI